MQHLEIARSLFWGNIQRLTDHAHAIGLWTAHRAPEWHVSPHAIKVGATCRTCFRSWTLAVPHGVVDRGNEEWLMDACMDTAQLCDCGCPADRACALGLSNTISWMYDADTGIFAMGETAHECVSNYHMRRWPVPEEVEATPRRRRARAPRILSSHIVPAEGFSTDAITSQHSDAVMSLCKKLLKDHDHAALACVNDECDPQQKLMTTIANALVFTTWPWERPHTNLKTVKVVWR